MKASSPALCLSFKTLLHIICYIFIFTYSKWRGKGWTNHKLCSFFGEGRERGELSSGRILFIWNFFGFAEFIIPTKMVRVRNWYFKNKTIERNVGLYSRRLWIGIKFGLVYISWKGTKGSYTIYKVVASIWSVWKVEKSKEKNISRWKCKMDVITRWLM